MLIGRHLSAVDIYLNSSVNKKLISRQHAELWIECHHDTQVVYLLDKSTNGTFINDIKIVGKVRLTEGDTLTFGHTQGIRIQPGMHKQQPKSEFRFVLEKASSENTPPHSASSFISDRQSPSACRHQHSPDFETNVSTSTSMELLTHQDHYQEGAVNGQECFQSLPCTTNVKLSPVVCQSSPKICTVDCNQLKCDFRDDTVAALSAEPFTTCHQQGPVHQKRTEEFSEDAEKTKLHNTETDNELLELTSIISAKAAKFDSSDSDRDLEELLPVFPKTQQHLPPSKCIYPRTYPDAIALENSRYEAFKLESIPRSSQVLSIAQSQLSSDDDTYSSSACHHVDATHANHLPTLSTSLVPQFTSKQTSPQNIDGAKCKNRGGHAVTNRKKKKRRQGYLRTSTKSNSGVDAIAAQDLEAEVCDSYECCKPTDKTVDWVQCDRCDKWFHVACVGCDYDTVKKDSAAFNCGCTHKF
ncbi:uncharacterized protein LOC119732019 isoform X2 [Patiria miniata]|nr:uncharacterized protein LOC119732019 isoform X2 [Patiria miniata]